MTAFNPDARSWHRMTCSCSKPAEPRTAVGALTLNELMLLLLVYGDVVTTADRTRLPGASPSAGSERSGAGTTRPGRTVRYAGDELVVVDAGVLPRGRRDEEIRPASRGSAHRSGRPRSMLGACSPPSTSITFPVRYALASVAR
ncbi:hypothetical protein GCM10009634_49810 [Saccharothrix xinjiangensis]